MFGTYRYALALMVACGHIQFLLFGRPNWLGVYAVFGFYTLSGYLMTRVLHETYGYTPSGFLRYITNRPLRIYPPYWVAVAGTVAILSLYPKAAGPSSWLVYIPRGLAGYARNIALLGMYRGVQPALVPPVWSLHVEVVFYLLMGLGLSSSRRMAGLWLALSLAWTAWALWTGISFGDRYSTVMAGSLAFSTGATTYFLSRWRAPWMWFAPAMFFPHALLAPFLWNDVYTGGFYASFALAPLCILSFAGWRPPTAWAKWDRRLGDLSYPIFLLHTQFGFLVREISPIPLRSTFGVFLMALPLLHIVGLAIHHGLVRPLEVARKRFRHRPPAVVA